MRRELRASHSSALEEKRLPTHAEITGSNIPYLNAFIEELFRLAHTVSAQNRSNSKDTVLLGYRIPKGTMVFFSNRGPSFTEPPMPIDEAQRHETSQQALKDGRARSYDALFNCDDDNRLDLFLPERWLVSSSETGGKEVFDPAAWPTMPFGAGERACFGRRLAYMELKLLVTLLVWKFDFMQCPDALSSYEDIEVISRKPIHNYVCLSHL